MTRAVTGPIPARAPQCAAPAPLLELRIGKGTNDSRRIAKGTHPVGWFVFAFEDVRNPLQGGQGVAAVWHNQLGILSRT